MNVNKASAEEIAAVLKGRGHKNRQCDCGVS